MPMSTEANRLRTHPAPLLESWYRDKLDHAAMDLSSSGVHPYRFAELRSRAGLGLAELDDLVVGDSTSFGDAQLRKAIADRYAGGRTERVMVAHGSSEAISLVLGALCHGGGRVVVTDPVYHSLRTIPGLHGCELAVLPISAVDATGNFTTDLSEVITEETRAIVVNFPNNPTGKTLSTQGWAELGRHAARVGAYLVDDAAFSEIVWLENAPDPRATPQDPMRVTFGTFSKCFGLPGLRVGWCIADPDILDATLAQRDRTTLFLSPLVETVARRAMLAADELIGPRRAEAAENLGVLERWVRERRDVVDWESPGGGVCVLMRFAGVSATREFCRKLLRDTGVLLVPGDAFGRPDAVRVGFGGRSDTLAVGLQRLSGFLDGAQR